MIDVQVAETRTKDQGVLNLPNQITLGRFALALLLFAWLVATDTCSGTNVYSPVVAGIVFVLAVATDFLDGYFARKLKQISHFGRIADPVVDKVIVCGSFIFLVSAQWAQAYIPVWVAVLIVAREFLVNGLRGYLEARGVPFAARWDGKLKMILQCCAIPAVFLVRALELSGLRDSLLFDASRTLAFVLVWTTFVLTVASGVRYVLAAARELRQAPGA